MYRCTNVHTYKCVCTDLYSCRFWVTWDMFQKCLCLEYLGWCISVHIYMARRKNTFCLLLVRAEKYRFEENECSNCISPCFWFERHELVMIGTWKVSKPMLSYTFWRTQYAFSLQGPLKTWAFTFSIMYSVWVFSMYAFNLPMLPCFLLNYSWNKGCK